MSVVNVPPVVSAEIAPPPVAAVYNGVTAVIAGLVAAGFDPSLRSLAVIVAEPSVLRVMLKFWLPATRLVLAGNEASASLELRPTKSVAVATLFQVASTSLPVTEKHSPKF